MAVSWTRNVALGCVVCLCYCLAIQAGRTMRCKSFAEEPCSDAGLNFTYCTDCDFYLTCNGSHTVMARCPVNQTFHNLRHVCVPANETNCSGTTTSTTTTTTTARTTTTRRTTTTSPTTTTTRATPSGGIK